MTKRRFTPWIALACIGTLAACTSGEGGTAGNTELNVIVPTNAGTPNEIDITTVEYTITCAGNSDTFLDNGASFADEIRIDGNLEVVDGRTDTQGAIPPEFGTPRPGDGAEVWQGFRDLPPGPCNIELRARDNDGEVICTALEPFVITADTLSKVNLVLICDTSFQAPVGTLDVDATFSFNVGNFCPDQFILNCTNSDPEAAQVLPPPNPPLAATTCEVRFRDGDGICGAGCDPQTCTPTATGLACTPGPDPGVSTTITCNAATLLDCEGDGVPEASCTLNGDTLGNLPVNQTPVPCATALDCVAAIGPLPGIACTNNFCDLSNTNPFLNLSFAVACVPPALGGIPGAVVTCTAVTTDGDTDCDKTQVVNVNCPGLTPCETEGGDASCDNGSVCTVDTCDDSLAVAGSCAGGICCVSDATGTDGLDCSAENPPLASCAGGVCQSDSCTLDSDCDSGAACTEIFAGICNVGTGICAPEANSAAGLACDAGAGASSGACDGAGACQDICSFNPACPDDVVGVPDNSVCTAATCDPADGTCGQTPTNNGGVCDFSGPGSADGNCTGGLCTFQVTNCGTSTGTVQLGCTNGVTSAQSPFPNQMTVVVNEPVFGGQPFNADVSGIGAFPKFFLDAAQSTVPGGVRAAIIEGFNTTATALNGSGSVLLQADPSGITPGLVQFCQYPASRICTADSDCVVPPCNTPVLVAEVPISEDCVTGGFCNGIGQGFDDGPGAQCNITDPPSFCVTGDLLVPLFAPGGIASLTAGPASDGEVIFTGLWIRARSSVRTPSRKRRSASARAAPSRTAPTSCRRRSTVIRSTTPTRSASTAFV